jgi:tetratricopeptide (TPR) repeat protein
MRLSSTASILLGTLACGIVLAVFASRYHVERVWEDAMYGFFPSASRAYSYGERHFSALNPARYDLDRAEYFFNKAVAQDPDNEKVLHQLARIEFLRGKLPQAYALINMQIARHGELVPSSYYVRGLIAGYMDRYADAAKDYEKYLESDPKNWAAINDLAWVLMKDGRYQEATVALEKGLESWPDNAWLLNSQATAFYELGKIESAYAAIQAAHSAAGRLRESDWSTAYPGNDPLIAREGLHSLQKSIEENMHSIAAQMKK